MTLVRHQGPDSSGRTTRPSCARKEAFIPVFLATLCPTDVLDFDLYELSEKTSEYVLYREKSYPLEQDDIDRLRRNRVETLYVARSGVKAYHTFVRDVVLSETALPPTEKYRVLRAATRTVWDTSFTEDRQLDRTVKTASEFARHMVDIICSDDLIMSDLLGILEHDYCTYTHVTNVCAYSVALAYRLGILDRSELTEIGKGALLHDIGKEGIAPYILNQPRGLTNDQFEYVRDHPQKGFEKLCHRDDLSFGQLMMVYQHHERPDGTGYPTGLSGDGIHSWARICTVADVFEALTSHRPYRNAVPIERVLARMQEKCPRHFDGEIVRCWYHTVQENN